MIGSYVTLAIWMNLLTDVAIVIGWYRLEETWFYDNRGIHVSNNLMTETLK